MAEGYLPSLRGVVILIFTGKCNTLSLCSYWSHSLFILKPLSRDTTSSHCHVRSHIKHWHSAVFVIASVWNELVNVHKFTTAMEFHVVKESSVMIHRNRIASIKLKNKVSNNWTFVKSHIPLFSRAVPTALLFKWEWNLVKFWVKSHEISQVSSATWRLERMEPSDWLRWVVTWLCSEIWPKGKQCGHYYLFGNNMKTVPIDRGDQELSKTFCQLKIGPLLRKLRAFKDW